MKQTLTIAMIGSKGIPAASGGVERHVEELSTRLVRQGLRVLVYTRPWYTPRKQSTYKGVELRPLPSIHTKHLDAITHTFIAVLHATLIESVDIVHLHGIGPALLTPLVQLIPGVRVVVTYHSPDYYHQKWGWFARMSLRIGEWVACRFADELIVVSKELERHVWAVYRRASTMIPNGAAVVTGRTNIKPIQERLGIPRSGYILYVGRLIPHKGVHTLIAAWKALRTNIPLVIVGEGYHTDRYVQSLNALAGANDHIIFVGQRRGKELDALFRGASVVVQPSQSEGLSLSLLEAMSYAKPVVVSDIVENREVMTNPDFWFHSTDVNDLVRVLKFVMSRSDVSKAQGRANREMIERWYNWNAIALSTVIQNRSVVVGQPTPSSTLVTNPLVVRKIVLSCQPPITPSPIELLFAPNRRPLPKGRSTRPRALTT